MTRKIDTKACAFYVFMDASAVHVGYGACLGILVVRYEIKCIEGDSCSWKVGRLDLVINNESCGSRSLAPDHDMVK